MVSPASAAGPGHAITRLSTAYYSSDFQFSRHEREEELRAARVSMLEARRKRLRP